MNQFADMCWFALLISIALAVLSRRTLRERVKYTVIAFLAFIVISVAIGWLMYPFSH